MIAHDPEKLSRACAQLDAYYERSHDVSDERANTLAQRAAAVLEQARKYERDQQDSRIANEYRLRTKEFALLLFTIAGVEYDHVRESHPDPLIVIVDDIALSYFFDSDEAHGRLQAGRTLRAIREAVGKIAPDMFFPDQVVWSPDAIDTLYDLGVALEQLNEGNFEPSRFYHSRELRALLANSELG